MARPIRIEYQGGFYHVTSRGNARQDIFADAEDYRMFLSILADAIGRYRWLIHAYCLMGNHYHLLIETPQANLSQGMRQLNGKRGQVLPFAIRCDTRSSWHDRYASNMKVVFTM